MIKMNVSGGYRISEIQNVLGKLVLLVDGKSQRRGRWRIRSCVLVFEEEPHSRRLRKKK